MRLLALLKRESPVTILQIGAMAALSGFANAILLGVINAAAAAYTGQTRLRLLAIVICVIGVFILGQYYLLVKSTLLVQTVLDRMRQRLIGRIRGSDLVPLEPIGHSVLYTTLSMQIVTLSNAAGRIIGALQSAVTVVVSVFYLARLSMSAFFIATIVFIIVALRNIIAALPAFRNADAAVASLEEIEKTLNAAPRRALPEAVPATTFERFETITLDRVVYRYFDAEKRPLFILGPIDLTIQRGEIVFLAGRNGSGKSTLLKILTAFWYPQSGALLVDGEPLRADTYGAYRDLFSPIFVDDHLFEVPVDLSKPVQVLDECAADLDPVFRGFFYEVLLRDMKSAGKTVIAATRDDDYFHIADRVLMLEDGVLLPWGGRDGHG